MEHIIMSDFFSFDIILIKMIEKKVIKFKIILNYQFYILKKNQL